MNVVTIFYFLFIVIEERLTPQQHPLPNPYKTNLSFSLSTTGEVKQLVSGVLSRSPRNIVELRAMAGEEGMVTFSSQESEDL